MFRCTCSIPGKYLRDSCFQNWNICHSELLPYRLNLKRFLAFIHHQQTQSWSYGELFVFRSIWPKNVKGRLFWIVRGKLSNYAKRKLLAITKTRRKQNVKIQTNNHDYVHAIWFASTSTSWSVLSLHNVWNLITKLINHQLFSVSRFFSTVLTLRVTNINFLLTMQTDNPGKRLWELIRWSPKGRYFNLLSNFPN